MAKMVDEDGNEVNTGMALMLVRQGDALFFDLTCPHCALKFVAGEQAFLSYDLTVGIHERCILELTAAPRETQIERGYEERRAALLSDPA